VLQLTVHTFNQSAWTPAIVTRSLDPGTSRLGSAYNWFRWYLPTTITEERFLYMDCDTLVRRDVAELFDATMFLPRWHKPAAIAAVFTPQPLKHFLCAKTLTIRKWLFPRPDGTRVSVLSTEVKALNAGVLLFDSREWREQRALDKWHTLAVRTEKGGCLWRLAGQPELQLIFGEQIAKLDPRWNHGWLGSTDWLLRQYGPSFTRGWARNASTNAFMLHWNGPLKPWAMRRPPAARSEQATPVAGQPLAAALWWSAATLVHGELERCDASFRAWSSQHAAAS